MNLVLKRWNNLVFKPWILLSPSKIEWTRVHNREKFWQKFLIRTNGFCEVFLVFISQIKFLRIRTNEHKKLNIWHMFDQNRVPFFGKSFSGWQITIFPFSRIIKIHWQERKSFWIIKLLSRDTKPISECFATFVIPWFLRFLSQSTRSLTDNHNFRTRIGCIKRFVSFFTHRCIKWIIADFGENF